MPQYARVTPHSPIQEVFPDVFFVQGSFRAAPGFRFSRNMVVLREGDELTVINAVRLNDNEQARLDELGQVKHVMRIGTMHGMDDPYYVDRYDARFWCQEGQGQYSEPAVSDFLRENSTLPISGLRCLPFYATREPECVLLLERHGGLLIACDAMQDWTDYRQCTWPAKVVMPRMGFEKRVLVGPIWMKLLVEDRQALSEDFSRILQQDFAHFVAAHGGFRKDNAKAHVAQAIRLALPESE